VDHAIAARVQPGYAGATTPRNDMTTPPTDAIREIAKALRRHVDAETLERIVNDLLDVRGNRDFREAIEALARELMRR
jgi:hypothetical protein